MRVPGLSRCFAMRQSSSARKFRTPTWIVAALLFTSAVFSATASESVQRQVLSGHVPKITKRLSSLGRLDPMTTWTWRSVCRCVIGSNSPTCLKTLYDPSSPNFRHYLTPDQFTASFGPSREDYQKVIDFAKSNGLVVKRTHPNRTLLDVSGSVAEIEKAFHLHLLHLSTSSRSAHFFCA